MMMGDAYEKISNVHTSGKKLVKILGRYEKERPFLLCGTGSSMEFAVRGTQLWLNIEIDYDFHEPWIDILIDGALYQHRILTKEDTHICLFRNMEKERIKHVRILRSTQMMPDDPKLSLEIISLETDADVSEFEKVSVSDIKLEFIGDSVTSGEGCIGNEALMEWISMCFGHTNSYPYLVSEALLADTQVFSQSGYGLYCSYDGNYDHSLPAFYHQVSSVNKKPWDFSQFQPDFVIVNLGTNDAYRILPTTLHTEYPKLTEEELKELEADYRLRFSEAVKNFLSEIHLANPEAKIIWAYGILGNSLENEIRAGIHSFSEQNPDTAYFLKLEDTKEEEFGSRMHPGIISHRRAAEAIIQKIKSISKKERMYI